MADVPTRDRRDDGAEDPNDNLPGPPRWAKLFVIIVLILVVLGAVVHVASSDGHGRHGPSGMRGTRTPWSTLLIAGVGDT